MTIQSALPLANLERFYASTCIKGGMDCQTNGLLRWYDWLSADQVVRIFFGDWSRLASFRDDLHAQLLRLPQPVVVLAELPFANGFKTLMDNAGMAISLEAWGMGLMAWPQSKDSPLPAGCSLTLIKSPEQLRDYANLVGTFLTGHRQAETLVEQAHLWEAMLTGGSTYLAVVDAGGNLIASTTVYQDLAMDCAGIYHVVTHPDWRGQGLADYLLRRALEMVQQSGLTNVILQTAMPNARRIYERLGFSESVAYRRWTRKE